ncbi:MAG TPA: transglycosylase domain-containing protein [Pseudomonadales bacterium]|nr:transglycosylase domain-containing protein [Pseudomonadales bacterium]
MRRRIFVWCLRITLALAVVGGLALCAWLFHLDRVITSTFEGRRWSIPAQVYAQPLELFVGRRLSLDQFTFELDRLGYGAGRVDGPGTYRTEGQAVRTVLRPFAFADGARGAVPLRVRFEGTRIAAIDTARGDEIELIRVEPPLIGSIFPSHGEDRLIVQPGETPELLLETLKAVEDRNFDRHLGFDPKAMLRALWVNLRAGGVEQGGSTLTQQLVKSYYLDNRRTIPRKLKELAMAVVLELRFEKADLLNAYINEIYIGQDGARAIHGFGLASQYYFAKPLADLDAHEIALLVAVIRGPSYYNPLRNTERALARRNRVLDTMLQFELIDAATHGRARGRDLGVLRTGRRAGRYYPAFMDLVRSQLDRDYDAGLLATNGFRVFTTLSPVVQESAERAVAGTLARIEAERDLDEGALQAAIVVTSPQTGEVQAIVGGRDAGSRGFNYAVNGRRPIGSLIKPVVYLTAFEADPNLTLASIIDDVPVRVPNPSGPPWMPRNFDGRPQGEVPVIRALADSLNLATVNLGLAVGVERVAQRLGELLDAPPPEPFPSLLLGAGELSPMEVAQLYGTFAGTGFAAPLKTVIAVEDRGGARLDRYPLVTRQVADPRDVLQVNHALKTVMTRGTGKGSLYAGRGVAGKTGTSDDFRDAWFAGFDANLLAIVWVGHVDNESTGLTGSSGALPVWDALMSELAVTPVTIPVPNDYLLREIDFATGELADASCGDPVTVPLPSDLRLPPKAGCPVTLQNLGDRIRSWFD